MTGEGERGRRNEATRLLRRATKSGPDLGSEHISWSKAAASTDGSADSFLCTQRRTSKTARYLSCSSWLLFLLPLRVTLHPTSILLLLLCLAIMMGPKKEKKNSFVSVVILLVFFMGSFFNHALPALPFPHWWMERLVGALLAFSLCTELMERKGKFQSGDTLPTKMTLPS